MKLSILSSDTPHHRYFLHKINNSYKIDAVFFETEHYKPKFDTSSPFEEDEIRFEEESFFEDVPNTLIDAPLFYFDSLNSIEALNELKNQELDIGIVFGTGKLKPSVINSFSKYLMNIHRGIPEKYRGLDSDLWAIYKSDYANIGTTIHLVEPELDTGEIVGQSFLELDKEMRAYKIRFYTTLLAVEISLKAIKDIKEGSFSTQPQKIRGSYYSFMDSTIKSEVDYKFTSYCKKL